MEYTKLKNYRIRLESLWILSGLALASCGGGGGGGSSANRPVIADAYFIPTPATADDPAYTAYASESPNPVRFGGVERLYSEDPTPQQPSTQADAVRILNTLLQENDNAFHLPGSDGIEYRQDGSQVVVTIMGIAGGDLVLTFSLSGADADDFRLVPDADGISLVSRGGLDYEDGGSAGYDITATITARHPDFTGGTATFSEDFKINILNVSEDEDRPIPAGEEVQFAYYEANNETGYEATAIAHTNPTRFVSLKSLIEAELSASPPGLEADSILTNVKFKSARKVMNMDLEATITLSVEGEADIMFDYEISANDDVDGPEAYAMDIDFFHLVDLPNQNDVQLQSKAFLPRIDPVAQDSKQYYTFTETVTTTDPRVPAEQQMYEANYYLYVINTSDIPASVDADTMLTEFA